MNDKQQAEVIMKMTALELLDYVMTFPEYLMDSYYKVFGDAIRARYKELK
jgi:hypothetical protein